MSRASQRALLALLSGALFGVGLAVSGMTRPEKVLGFLDVAGAWDASLTCVMAAAVAVHFLAYGAVRGRTAPWLADRFFLPTARDIDVRLCAGALLFGVGWGLGGYCPGPSLVSLASGGVGVVVFVVAMLVGMRLVGAIIPCK